MPPPIFHRLARTLHRILGCALRRTGATLALCAAAGTAMANEVTLTSDQISQDLIGVLRVPALQAPERPADAPQVDPTSKEQAFQHLRGLIARGKAHGFDGILYDNRDRGHSRLKAALFPGLTHLRYGPDLMTQEADYGLAGQLVFSDIVLGNSSTALVAGPSARSLSRLAMTTAGRPAESARLYMTNHLYVYPEHRDHDAIDFYPANWPYHVISQGSSGSDRPFLRALAGTLAAFQSDTLEAMKEARVVAPTLQMMLRRNLDFVRTDADYHSGKAHRPVIDSAHLQPMRMITHANSLRPEDIAPLVRLTVEQESFANAAGLAGVSEILFTTPAAIARVWRDFAWEQTMVVSAKRTKDPNGHDLTFSWHLLQGDPERVTITPLDPEGISARITLRWQESFILPEIGRNSGQERVSARVDIGVFADNGRSPSAPAMISVSFPAHQKRTYSTGKGADQVRLTGIDYDAVRNALPFDPLLHWSAAWQDIPVYDPGGALTGWQRRYADPKRADAAVPHPPPANLHAFKQVGGQMIVVDDADPP